MARYTVLLFPDLEDGENTALIPALPGCVSEGDSIEEALTNIKEAAVGWLEVARDQGDDIPNEGPGTVITGSRSPSITRRRHMRKHISLVIALIALAAALGVPPATSHAQAAQTCLPTALTQRDLEGVWTAIDGPIQLTVYPCGGTVLAWRNTDGASGAAMYLASEPLIGGGYIASIHYPDPEIGTPWATQTVAYLPAARGQILIRFWVPHLGQWYVYHAIRTTGASKGV